jgi:hypothetical protein
VRFLTIVGAFLVSVGLLIVLLFAADAVWTLFNHGHLGARRALWMLAPLGMLAAGGALLALSTRRRYSRSD